MRHCSGRRWFLGCVAVLVTGCSGAPDWRELRPAGLSLRFAMPCRPDVAERRLTLSGAEVDWRLWSCSADEHTFALASATLPDATRVAAVLDHLGRSAQSNIRGRIESETAAAVRGMTPQAGARRWRLAGHSADGHVIGEEVLVFAYGARVYQATVIGRSPDRAQAQMFFERIEVVP